MARYSDIVVDQYNSPVPGVQITVLATTTPFAPISTLTTDAGTALGNPIITAVDGSFYFNAPAATYTLQFKLAGTISPFKVQPIDMTGLNVTAGLAPLASPSFTGAPTAPTLPVNTNTNGISTTAFVIAQLNSVGYAPLVAPAFTGVPTAPTASPGTNTSQIATTSFVSAGLVAFAAPTGASLVGFNPASSYAAGTVGKYLQTFDTFDRFMQVKGSFILKPLGAPTTVPVAGTYFGSGGMSLSFQTLVSSPVGRPDSDNQRAQMLLAATTTDDGNSEEQNLCLLTTIQTGYSKPWAVSTAFAVGDNIRNKTANTVYRCITAGTSASTGTGPSTVALGIADGTCVWNWINDSAIDAKTAFYNEIVVAPGAGNSWGQANNFQVQAGVITDFACNTELDLYNACGTNSIFGGLNKYNLYLANTGPNVSTSNLEILSNNTANFASLWGAHFTGAKLASNAIIGIDASSAVGLAFGVNGGGAVNPTFTDSVINDSAIAPVGIKLGGTYASSAMAISGVTPAAISITGTKSFAAIFDQSTSPQGLYLNGTYSSFQILGNGFSVKPNGGLTAKLDNFASDAAAGTGGVSIGQMYHNAGVVRVRLT